MDRQIHLVKEYQNSIFFLKGNSMLMKYNILTKNIT